MIHILLSIFDIFTNYLCFIAIAMAIGGIIKAVRRMFT